MRPVPLQWLHFWPVFDPSVVRLRSSSRRSSQAGQLYPFPCKDGSGICHSPFSLVHPMTLNFRKFPMRAATSQCALFRPYVVRCSPHGSGSSPTRRAMMTTWSYPYLCAMFSASLMGIGSIGIVMFLVLSVLTAHASDASVHYPLAFTH